MVQECCGGWFPLRAVRRRLDGEEWGGTPIDFQVHAATEGDATCHNTVGDGSGEWISLVRSISGVTSGWVDDYFHLSEDTCGQGGWTQHFEQGDALAIATGSGTSLKHLHYEPRIDRDLKETSRFHWLSGVQNFCDHNDMPYLDQDPNNPPEHDGEPYYPYPYDTVYQCAEAHANQWQMSDNAGPGQGAGNALIGAGMALTYRNIGHWYCGAGHAWNCNGSSNAYYGGTEKAWYSTQAGDSAWHQQFKNSGDYQGNLSSPNACGGTAYWVPHANFVVWLNYAGTLGQPRSSYFQSGGYWVQYFRHGALVATSFGGNPGVPQGGEYTNCYP